MSLTDDTLAALVAVAQEAVLLERLAGVPPPRPSAASSWLQPMGVRWWRVFPILT